MIIVGIDPGATGAIAILNGWSCPAVHDLPMLTVSGESKPEIDVVRLRAMLRTPAIQPDLVVIEKVWGWPRDGASRSFTFGRGYGMILGCLALMGLQEKVIRIAPKTWKASILAGTAGGKPDALAYVQRIFPIANLRAEGKRKDSYDRAEAVCLAVYGRQYLGGSIRECDE